MTLDRSAPTICLVTAGECDADNYWEQSNQIVEVARAAADRGVDLIQLREKRLSGKLLFELTQTLAAVVKGSRTQLLVNDRSDIALAGGAHGVHLTSTSIPVQVAREHLPSEFQIGVSCHTQAEVVAAANGGADYVLFGPVFPTPGKVEGIGLERLNQACVAERRIPVLAIGGIDETNCSYPLVLGAAGFAAIRSLNDLKSLGRIMQLFPR